MKLFIHKLNVKANMSDEILSVYIYIYIYMYVCMYVCLQGFLMGTSSIKNLIVFYLAAKGMGSGGRSAI